MKTVFFPRAAAVLVIAASTAAAALDPDAGTAGIRHISVLDKEAMLEAAQDGMTMVQLGERAEDKAVRADVKEFGAMLVKDHGELNSQLKTLALKKNVELPEKLDLVHGGAVDRLAKLTASQFDAAFIEDMIKAHRENLADLQKAAEQTRDAGVKTFLNNAVAKVKMHLAKIQKIAVSKGG